MPATTAPGARSAADPVPVPVDFRRCHPMVQTARGVKARDGWLDTCRSTGMAHVRVHLTSQRRCLLLVQALIDESERRGYEVGCAEHCKGLAFVVRGHTLEVAMKEATTRVPHQLTAAEQKERDRGYGYGIPNWDYLPTGHLAIRTGHGSGGNNLATDGQRRMVEEQLSTVFERLETLASQAEASRQERLRAEEERQVRRVAALGRAREEYFTQSKVKALSAQLDRQRVVTEGRRFVGAARKSTRTPEEEEWLSWIEKHLVAIDPMNGSLQPPTPPEPTIADLSPYLLARNLHWS